MTVEESKAFKKAQWRFIVCSMVAYAFFYITRKNLSMAQPLMIEEGVITKMALGTIMTVHGVLYGLSRFVNGFWADRLNGRVFMADLLQDPHRHVRMFRLRLEILQNLQRAIRRTAIDKHVFIRPTCLLQNRFERTRQRPLRIPAYRYQADFHNDTFFGSPNFTAPRRANWRISSVCRRSI